MMSNNKNVEQRKAADQINQEGSDRELSKGQKKRSVESGAIAASEKTNKSTTDNLRSSRSGGGAQSGNQGPSPSGTNGDDQ